MKKDDFLTTFFSFKENPFALTPDPKYLFLGEKHREVLAHLTFGVREDKGFMVVVGEVGTGKTTLCRAFINHLLEENVEVGLIYNPALTDLEMLQAVNREFKLPSDLDSKGKLIEVLNAFLLRVSGESRQVVLIIDEAQFLTSAALDELRLISNMEGEFGKLLVICLVGQVELEAKLRHKKHRSLRQRTTVRYRLKCLNKEETQDYLAHRLAVAGNDNAEDVFSLEAMDVIFKLSRGIPREINVLADRSLLNAYLEDQRIVEPRHVESVASEFGFEGISVGLRA